MIYFVRQLSLATRQDRLWAEILGLASDTVKRRSCRTYRTGGPDGGILLIIGALFFEEDLGQRQKGGGLETLCVRDRYQSQVTIAST